MTTAAKIIERTRLQAACEQAWREATYLHKADAWKHPHRDWNYLYLRALMPSVTVFNPNDPPNHAKVSPMAVATIHADLSGHVIVITAPGYDPDFFWNAAKFHWRDHHIEFNFTN